MPTSDRRRAGTESVNVLAIAATLTVAVAASFLMSFVVSILAPVLVSRLGLTRAQVGSLLFVMYSVGAICSLGIGSLVSKLGSRLSLVIMLVVTTATFALVASAASYLHLVVIMIVSGAAFSGVLPATNALVERWIPERSRGGAVGVKQAGGQVGATFASILVPALVVTVGWRSAVLAASAVPLLGVGMAWRLIPAAVDDKGAELRRSTQPMTTRMRVLFAYPILLALGTTGTISYLPLYAFEEVNLSLRRSGFLLALVSLVAILAHLSWGYWAGRVRRIVHPLALVPAFAVISVLLILFSSEGREWPLWLGAAGIGASACAWLSVAMVGVIRASGSVAASLSRLMISGLFFGSAVGPVLFGFIVDRTGNYRAGWGLFSLGYIGAALIILTLRSDESLLG